MIIYLAGFKSIEKIWNKPTNDIYLLSSYYEHLNGRHGDYVMQKRHILDSGAFSFLKGKTVEWNSYVEKYISFIKKTKQELFFELDIYKIIGQKETEEIRNRIEQSVGLQTIPVWHRHLGIDYWHFLSENYKYIAIGGFAIGDIKPAEYKFIASLLNIAKSNNCKVHGLGFTSTKSIVDLKLQFYSVDSTTWNVGRYGNVCTFREKDKQMRQLCIINRSKGALRISDLMKLHIHNFAEWVKFQKYMDGL